MTEIPGTGKITPAKVRKEREEKRTNVLVEKLSTVNIKEIKRSKRWKPKGEPEDELWYNQLRYWVLFGTSLGIVFILLGLIINWRFIFLSIVGPLSGWISWYIRKLVRQFGKETDIYIKQRF